MDEAKRRDCYSASRRCCETNETCGYLPQIVYIPVFVAPHNRSCQSTCQKCGQSTKPAFVVGDCKSSNNLNCQNCNYDEVAAPKTNGCISGQNDQYYKLCGCDGNPHFSRVSIPQIALKCASVSASGSAQFCQCQAPSQNNRLQHASIINLCGTKCL